jgi:O-succinylbenzoic acid--CoA ligase
MTETAAMATWLFCRRQFLAGRRSNGRVLPHAAISAVERHAGLVTIAAEQIRFSAATGRPGGEEATFVTEDLGRLDADGHLHVLGRRDAVINSGGEKNLSRGGGGVACTRAQR